MTMRDLRVLPTYRSPEVRGASITPAARPMGDGRYYRLPSLRHLRQSNTRQSLATNSLPNTLTKAFIGKQANYKILFANVR